MPRGLWVTRWWWVSVIGAVLIETWRYLAVAGLAAYGLWRLVSG